MLTNNVKRFVLTTIAGFYNAEGSMATGYQLGLSSTEPTVDGTNFTEPDASTGYARINIHPTGSGSQGPVFPFEWVSTTGADAYKAVQNKYEIHFNVATSNWGAAVSYVGIFDNSNRLLAFGNIVDSQGDPTSITVLAGHIPTIAVGQAKISLVDIQ